MKDAIEVGVRRVVAAAGLCALAACGSDDPGRAAYVSAGCGRCHGSDLSGNRLGPPLTDLARHWDRASLEAFLARPDTVRKGDPRLARLSAAYPAPMPVYEMPDSLRSAIAGYLISPSE